jgi:hypothetical protein
MKFGIHSRINYEWMKKSTRTFHRLLLGNGYLNVRRFFDVVGPIYGKEQRCQGVMEHFATTSKCQDYRKEGHRGKDGERFHVAAIVKIEDLGNRPLWDITVPDKGWLVAGGICAHNSGKSTCAAAMALLSMLLEAPALVLLASPSQRQSSELFRKVTSLYHAIGAPVPATQLTALSLTLATGSRCVSLPGNDDGQVRGFSCVRTLILDEACRVSSGLYAACRPMLAVSGGRLVALSSAWGRSGWFYEAWEGESPEWERVQVTADQCQRIPKDFLQTELAALGPVVYGAEYACQWASCQSAVFTEGMIQSLCQPGASPLWSSAPSYAETCEA